MTCTRDERSKMEYFGSLIILLELTGVRLLTLCKKKGEFSISPSSPHCRMVSCGSPRSLLEMESLRVGYIISWYSVVFEEKFESSL